MSEANREEVPAEPAVLLVDSHCHLQSLGEDQVERALDEARARGVGGFMVPAIRLSDAERVLALAHRHPDVWCALGVHPHDASTWLPGDTARLRSLLSDPRVVAVGECGLDFHYDNSPRDVQERVLEKQWGLAVDTGLPVVVHNRDSDEVMSRLVARWSGEGLTGVFHSFAGNLELADQVVAGGYYLGVSGMVTFPRSDNIRAILERIPPDRLLVETDTPYLAPVPHRGKPNRPAWVLEIAQRVAEEFGEGLPTVAGRTTANFFRLFRRAG